MLHRPQLGFIISRNSPLFLAPDSQMMLNRASFVKETLQYVKKWQFEAGSARQDQRGVVFFHLEIMR